MTESTMPPGFPTSTTRNDRPCALCKHFDERLLPSNVAYCWRFCVWRGVDEVVVDCPGAERADGKVSPFVINFGPQT